MHFYRLCVWFCYWWVVGSLCCRIWKMNECYFKPPHWHLLLVELWSSGPGVSDSPVICDNGITEKIINKKTWHCECAKQSFNFWSKCTFKSEILKHVSSSVALDVNTPEAALRWYEQPHPTGRTVTFTSRKAVQAHLPPSSLKLNLCLLMFFHKVPKKILSCFKFCLNCPKRQGPLFELHSLDT